MERNMLLRSVAAPLLALSFFVQAAPPASAVWRYEEVFTVDHLFGRIHDIAFGASGELIVLDGGNAEFLVLDESTGEIVRRVGRRGQGPGEFNEPRLVAASETGEVLVYDALAGDRLTTFGPEGGYQKTTTIARPESLHSIAVSSDGMLGLYVPFTTSGLADMVDLPAEAVEEMLGVATQEEHPTLSLHTENGDVRQLWEWQGIAPTSPLEFRPFAPTALWSALSDSRVVVASSHEYLIRILDLSGNEVGTIRREVEAMLVTDEAKERIRATVSGELIGIHFDSFRPLIQNIFPGPQGNIMVVRPSFGAPDRDLDIFSNRGEHLGTVQLPAAFRAMAGRDGLIAGIQVNSDDEYVVRVVRIRE